MKTIRNFLFINMVIASVAIFDTIATQLVDKYPVSIGEQGYRTLFDAVQAAPNKATIQIHQNMTINQEIAVVNKAITIKPVGDITILRGYNYDGHLFKIVQGAFLALATNIQNDQSRLVIDGDGKSHFIIGQDERQVYFDENASRQIGAQQRYYRDYSRNVDVPIEESGQRYVVCNGGQQYVVCNEGRRLYIDGTKRKIVMEEDGDKLYIDEVFIDPELRQFTMSQHHEKVLIDTKHDNFYLDDKKQKVVVRLVSGCLVVNYGNFVMDGNVMICNNYNLPRYINVDCVYDQNTPYGAVYNKGIFNFIKGYIGWNEGNGVFNAKDATFNMYNDAAIFKNFAYHGAGLLNYGIAILYGGKLSTNIAYFHGAGFYNRGIMEISGGIISGNETDFSYANGDTWNSGGGGYNDTKGILTIKGGLIEKNYSKNGGGLYNKGSLKINNCSITQNAALAMYYAIHKFVPREGWVGFTEDDVFRGYKVYDLPGNIFGNGGGLYTIVNVTLRSKIHIEHNVQTHGKDIYLKGIKH